MTAYGQRPGSYILKASTSGVHPISNTTAGQEGKIVCNSFSEGRDAIWATLHGGHGVQGISGNNDLDLVMYSAFHWLMCQTEDIVMCETEDIGEQGDFIRHKGLSEVTRKWRNALNFVSEIHSFDENKAGEYPPLRKALTMHLVDGENGRDLLEVMDVVYENMKVQDGGWKDLSARTVLGQILDELKGKSPVIEAAEQIRNIPGGPEENSEQIRETAVLAALNKLPGLFGPRLAISSKIDLLKVMTFINEELSPLESGIQPTDRAIKFNSYINSLIAKTERLAQSEISGAALGELVSKWETVHDVICVCSADEGRFISGGVMPLLSALADLYEKRSSSFATLVAVWDDLPREKARAFTQALKQVVHFSSERKRYVEYVAAEARKDKVEVDGYLLMKAKSAFTLHLYAELSRSAEEMARSARGASAHFFRQLKAVPVTTSV